MTVIAWDGESVAADKQCSGSGPNQLFKKIHRLESGAVVAIYGAARAAFSLLEWKRGVIQEYPKDFSEEGFMVIFEGGGVSVYSCRSSVALPVTDKFMAWGSGASIAIGAMAAGARAKEAVRIASRYDPSCGLGVDVLKVRK